MFSCKQCETFRGSYFQKYLRRAASVHFKIKSCIQHPAVNYLRCFCKMLLAGCLAVQNTSLEIKLLQGCINFFLGARLFDRARKKWLIKTNVCVQSRHNFLFVLYYLNRACSFHYSFASFGSFCNETFVDLMLF